jgi:hypothetical protein
MLVYQLYQLKTFFQALVLVFYPFLLGCIPIPVLITVNIREVANQFFAILLFVVLSNDYKFT